MGSFNFTCVVSGLPIQAGDRVRVLLLTENSRADESVGHRGLHMHSWWMPRTFPLRAAYNDYGSIEDVEEGAGRDLWLDTLKIDLIPKGTGDNTAHDVSAGLDMDFATFLEALWEGRVQVSRRLRSNTARLTEQPNPDEGKPKWLPTLGRVRKALKTLPESSSYGAEGWLVDELAYGTVRVRWVDPTFGRDTAPQLAKLQELLPGFATVVTAGSGSYSHGNPELLVLPKSGKDHHLPGLRDEDPPLMVSYAMIREDVWQALLTMPGQNDYSGKPSPVPDQYKASLTEAYAKGLEAQHKKTARIAALKTAKGEARDKLYADMQDEMIADMDFVPSDTLWIIDRRSVLGPCVGLAQQWQYLIEKGTPLEDAQGFIDSVAELAYVQSVLQPIRFIWRPSSSCGPQVGDFIDHVKFFEVMLRIAHTNALEQEDNS